jgi:hypothetical protein
VHHLVAKIVSELPPSFSDHAPTQQSNQPIFAMPNLDADVGSPG